MLASSGIALVVIAMLSWGVGDFLIQKSSRKLGDWETLFVIAVFGAVILAPFAWKDMPMLLADTRGLLILAASGILLTAAAIFEFEAFKRGKISVIEPMLPFEIPAASILAFLLLGDVVTPLQLTLVIVLIVGLFLISFRGNLFSKKFLAEKGVFIGLTGAGLMGFADFFLGWGSRVTDPIVSNFVVNVIMMLFSGVFLVVTGRTGKLMRDIRANRGLALVMSITDNVAWVAYAFAMSIIPIAVATGLSEASVIIAVLLGIFVNKERLQGHQKVGLVIAIAAAITLAFITA